MNLLFRFVFLISVLTIGCTQSVDNQLDKDRLADKAAIEQIHKDYVRGWLENDEELIMSLFEKGAMIQPSSLKPVKGDSAMRAFWFLKDGSVTTIDSFATEILNLEFLDTLAVTTHHSHLDWDYQKDSTNFGMIQKGIVTSVYRKQSDESWKIWRQMWTDIYAKPK